jgi:hypothetical protein
MMMNEINMDESAGAEDPADEDWEEEGLDAGEFHEVAANEADPRESTGASSTSFMFEPEQAKHRSKEPLISVIRAMPQVRPVPIRSMERLFMLHYLQSVSGRSKGS